jgi:hypothetical protein
VWAIWPRPVAIGPRSPDFGHVRWGGKVNRTSVRCEREGKLVHMLDPVSLVLLVVAVAVFIAAAQMLWAFVRSSSRDPLTPLAPDERSAWARRCAGVYVRRPQPAGTRSEATQPFSMDRAV